MSHQCHCWRIRKSHQQIPVQSKSCRIDQDGRHSTLGSKIPFVSIYDFILLSLPPRPLILALHGPTPPPRRATAVPAPTPPNENNLCADTLQAEGGGGRRRGLRSWLTKSESLPHFSFFPSSFPPHFPDKQTSPQSEKDQKWRDYCDPALAAVRRLLCHGGW